MPIHAQYATSKEVALTISFTALYVVFGFLKISPIIGLPGQTITAAAIMAPVMGVLLGPYVGGLSSLLGGTIGFFFGSFSLLGLSAGVVTAFCSGMILDGKRFVSILLYVSLLLVFAFYPAVGPAWLYPFSMWFQIIGLITLSSPLQSIATKSFDSDNSSRRFLAFFVTALTSTLNGQIAGSITLELIQMPDVNYFKGTWEIVTFLYPIERIVIALSATVIGVSLYRVLWRTNIMPLNRLKQKNDVRN